MAQNIPNSDQPTVRAYMKVRSFVSSDNPSSKELEKMDKELNAFLATIDSSERFLNGRNSYAIGNKIYTLVWYLERIEEKPVTTPFGNKDDKSNPSSKKSD
jgi:hypothetical protein